MAEPQLFGYKAAGEYEPALQAAIARARMGQARQRGQLAEATRRVRTSGVRFIPQETLERGFAESEAGLIGDFAQADVKDRIEDRRIAAERQFQRELFERGGDLQRALSRRQQQAALIGGGLGAISSIYRPRGG